MYTLKVLSVVLFLVYFAECRKIVPPIDKNANIAFINMEGGGGVRPPPGGAKTAVQSPNQASPTVTKPVAPTPAKPAPVPAKPEPVPAKSPAAVKPSPAVPMLAKPAQQPAQLTPKPVNPAPVANPITTPGPGSVKQLINFYDSQGKASPIRPYSYSQAVKQG